MATPAEHPEALPVYITGAAISIGRLRAKDAGILTRKDASNPCSYHHR